MTILVSNANGKVGQSLVQQLLAEGVAVSVGARDVRKAELNFPVARIVELDVSRPETVAAAMRGISALFTALPFELLPAGELALINAAKAAGVRRIVKLSAMGVESNPASPHTIVEAALAASGLEWTVLRPNFFMQNYATMMADSVRAGAIYEPADEGRTSYVDTRDIAAVAVKALTEAGHHGKAYTLTGGEALSRSDLAQQLSLVTGYPVAYVPVDDAALRGAMAGAHPDVVELMVAIYGYVRAGWTAAVSPDVEAVLGRKPITFASFARDHAAAWKVSAAA